MSKRRRHDNEPEEGIEKRLVNLIVRIGDSSLLDLPSHLGGLTSALGAELAAFRTLIIDTILDCVRGLQPKTPIYGALCGLLTASEPRFAEHLLVEFHRELQEALDDHATFSIRGYCRFAVELANARVLTVDSALDLLQNLLAVRDEPDVLPARAEWFVCIVLDCIALGGATFSVQQPDRFDALLEGARTICRERKNAPKSATPSLLLPYGEATKSGEVTEHIDALFSLVDALASDSYHWRSACLIAPSRNLSEQLEGVTPIPLPRVNVPAHSQGCTYPGLRRLRLGASLNAGDSDVQMRNADGSDKEDGDAEDKEGPGVLGVVDTVLLEEYTWMIVSQFQDSHKDAAKLLVAMQENLVVDACGPFIETILSMLLALPAPRHRRVYYACLLLDVSRLITPAPQMLVRSINALFASMPRLDPDLSLRLAEWLAFHISHFGFNLAPFEASWTPCLNSTGSISDENAHDAFVSYLLDKAVRLAYLERVKKDLPEGFVGHLPPKSEGRCAWAPLAEGAHAEPGALGTKSAALLNRLRSKAEQADVLDWLHRTVDASDLPTLVAHSLLSAGSKSVSHLERLLDKFQWLLADVASDPRARANLAAASAVFWDSSPQMTWIVFQKLIRREILDAQSIFAWVCSVEHRHRLAHHSTWEGIQLIFERALSQFKDTERDFKLEEKRYAEYGDRNPDDDDEDSPAAQRLAAKRANLEKARRDKKALFTNFFACICSALDEHSKTSSSSGETVETPWFKTTAGHTVAIGRRHLADFSLPAIEAVAEAEELSPPVNNAVFAPLKQLVAWQL